MLQEAGGSFELADQSYHCNPPRHDQTRKVHHPYPADCLPSNRHLQCHHREGKLRLESVTYQVSIRGLHSPESFGPFFMPLSLRAFDALLPFGRPRGRLLALLSSSSGTVSDLHSFRSKSGNISESHPTSNAPLPFAFSLIGNPCSGGGALGMPPKKAKALHSWSTTVIGVMVRNKVSNRACSYFVSSGLRSAFRSGG